MIIDDALRYAAAGWHVIPLKAGSKDPATKHGSKDGTTDEKAIRAWWEKWPNANVGVCTGHDGLVVLDVDVKKEDGFLQLAALEKRLGPWPPGPRVRTASGGAHLYARCDDLRNAQGLPGAPALDLRGRGGYVVAPGSRLSSGEGYTWEAEGGAVPVVPEAWVGFLVSRPRGAKLSVVSTKAKTPLVHEGQRDSILFREATALRWRGWSREAALGALRAFNQAVVVPPVDEETLRKKVASAWNYANEGDRDVTDIAGLCERYVWVKEQDDFFDLTDWMPVSAAQVNAQHAQHFKLRGPDCASAQILVSPSRQVTVRSTYKPGRERWVDGELNLYRGVEIEEKKGGIGPWEEHLEVIFKGFPAEREHLERWLAWLVQHPGERIEHGIILGGLPNLGKSIIGWVLSRLVGTENTWNLNTTAFHESFNGWAANRVLIVIDELKGFGTEDVQKMKTLIGTDSPIHINEKNRKPYLITPAMNFLTFTNERSALQVEAHDRRWWVFFSEQPGRPITEMAPLWDWVRANLPALLYHYRRVKVASGWNKCPPPETVSKSNMRLETLSTVADLILDLKEQGQFQAPVFSSTAVFAALQGYRVAGVTPGKMREALRSLGARRLDRRAREPGRDGKFVTVWAWAGADALVDQLTDVQLWDSMNDKQVSQQREVF